MKINIKIFALIILVFTINHSFANQKNNNDVKVLHTIEFDYKNYLEERQFAYEYFWNKKSQYMPWITLEHIGVAFYDINNDGQKELFAFVNGKDMCPRAGCPFEIFCMYKGIYQRILWSGGEIESGMITDVPRILNSIHNKYHDISFRDPLKEPEIAIWQWNGKNYE